MLVCESSFTDTGSRFLVRCICWTVLVLMGFGQVSSRAIARQKSEAQHPPGTTSNAQDDPGVVEPSADEIIDRFVRAIGGYEAIESTRNVHLVYECVQGNQSWTWEYFQEDGNFFGANIYDNGTSYVWRCVSQPDRLFGAEYRYVLWQEYGPTIKRFDPRFGNGYARSRTYVNALLNTEKLFRDVTVAGVERVRGELAYRIDFEGHDGSLLSRFFSIETGLMLRSLRPSRNAGDAPTQVEIFDYQPQGPFKDVLKSTRQVVTEGSSVWEYKLKTYEANLKIVPAKFRNVPQEMRDEVDQLLKTKVGSRADQSG